MGVLHRRDLCDVGRLFVLHVETAPEGVDNHLKANFRALVHSVSKDFRVGVATCIMIGFSVVHGAMARGDVE